jgi:hypothetical protein
LAEKVAVPGADGTETMVTAYQGIVQKLVRSLTTAKPKEILAILKAMDDLGVFDWMRQNAAPPPESKVSEEERQILAMASAQIAEFDLVSRQSGRPRKP